VSRDSENVLKADGTAGKIAGDFSSHHDFAVLRAHAQRLNRVVIRCFGLRVPPLDRTEPCEHAALIPNDGVRRKAPSHGAGVTSQVGGEVVRDRLWKREHDRRIGITLPRWQERTRK
jgi:hypothetical protein